VVAVVGAVVVAAVTGKQEVGQMVAAVVRRVKWVIDGGDGSSGSSRQDRAEWANRAEWTRLEWTAVREE
jgi:hypothetical protein